MKISKEMIRKHIHDIIKCNGNLYPWYVEEIEELMECEFEYFKDKKIAPSYSLHDRKYFDVKGYIRKHRAMHIIIEDAAGQREISFDDLDTEELKDLYSIRMYQDKVYIRLQKVLYAHEQETLDSFNDYVFNHGLNAYCLSPEYDNAMGIAQNPEWEICCSFEGQYCGSIGLYIKGDCKLASNTDVYSELNNRGERYTTKSFTLIYSPEEIELEEHGHGEAILTNTRIVGIWYLRDDDKTLAERLEEELKVKSVKINK